MLHPNTVTDWADVGGYKYPIGVDLVCPYPNCERSMHVSFEQWRSNTSQIRTCPSCKGRLTFAPAFPHNHKRGDSTLLHVYPPARPRRQPIDLGEPSPDLPLGLITLYQEMLDFLNEHKWRYAVINARMVVEGVLRIKTDMPSKMLRGLQAHLSAIGYTGTIEDVVDALRQGGNRGPHWNPFEAEPTPDLARVMVELAESFLSYAYVLPTRVAEILAILDGEITDPELHDLVDRATYLRELVPDNGGWIGASRTPELLPPTRTDEAGSDSDSEE